MKNSKVYIYIVSIILALGIAGVVSAQVGGSAVGGLNLWKLTSGMIQPVNPSYGLQVASSTVQGTMTASNFVATSTTATTTLAGGLVVDTNTLVADYSLNKVAITPIAGQVWNGLLNIMTTGSGVNSTGHLNLVNTSTGDSVIRISTTGSNDTWWMGVDTSDSNKFKIAENPGSGLGTVDYLTISPGAGTDGYVGIGTTTPYSKLSVTNTGTDPSFIVEDTTSPDSTPFIIDANGNVGFGTSVLDSSALTISSNFSNGIVQYNTADQSTNYERIKSAFTSNEFNILSQKGGTGSLRDIFLGFSTVGATGGSLRLQSDNLPYTILGTPGSNAAGVHLNIGMVNGTLSASSGTQTFTSITPIYNQTSTAGGVDLLINRTETATGTSAHSFISAQIASSEKFAIRRTGQIIMDATMTAGGTTGNQTIQNKAAGSVNLAAAASSITVTNNLTTTSSIILTNVRTNDATCTVKNAVPGSGSFVITMTAACTAETSVGFVVIN